MFCKKLKILFPIKVNIYSVRADNFNDDFWMKQFFFSFS